MLRKGVKEERTGTKKMNFFHHTCGMCGQHPCYKVHNSHVRVNYHGLTTSNYLVYQKSSRIMYTRKTHESLHLGEGFRPREDVRESSPVKQTGLIILGIFTYCLCPEQS